MKNLLILFFAFSLTGLFGQGGTSVNTGASQLSWKGYKVTGSHEGNIGLSSGELQFNDQGEFTGGSFTIDMTALTVTDLDGDMKANLEGHLKSADFFGVDKYPTAKLEILKAVPRGNGEEYKVEANLTIKETTAPVKFIAKVNKGAGQATAKIEVDRSVYDVRYGSGSFFDNLGDKTIYDIFELDVMLKI